MAVTGYENLDAAIKRDVDEATGHAAEPTKYLVDQVVREQFGLTNLKVMIPFCRTPAEGRKVIEVMRQAGLAQGQ